MILAVSGCLQGIASADEFGDFTYVDDGETITITGYPTTAAGPVAIPSSISGKPVTTIGSEAFANCGGITNLTIPASVTTIASDAFTNCDGLTNVSIPSSVRVIETYAFFDCDGLKTVTIPSSVTDMGNGVFDDCSLLDNVFFMGNAPNMGETVFVLPSANEDLKIYYFEGKTGFSSPWLIEEYPTLTMGTENPMAPWLIIQDLPVTSDPYDDSDGDGVNLLMACALNLNPNNNLSTSLPQTVVAPEGMNMSFYSGMYGITYTVETSTELTVWSAAGVTLSEMDGNQIRTATVAPAGSKRFMRLVVKN